MTSEDGVAAAVDEVGRSTAGLRIYHIEGRRSFRVIWLCEEIGLPYDLVFKQGDILGSLAMIREAYSLMPMAPVVNYDGQFLVESGAILEILLARHGSGRLIPAVNSVDFLFHTQWMHFAEGTAMCRMGSEFHLAQATGVSVSDLPLGYRAGVAPSALEMIGSAAVFDFAEDFLSKHAYFGGSEFSAADIMMHYALRNARLSVAIEPANFAHISGWLGKIQQRPAYGRATCAATPSGADEFGMPRGVNAFAPAPPERIRL
jgi:glutathione S-transferase